MVEVVRDAVLHVVHEIPNFLVTNGDNSISWSTRQTSGNAMQLFNYRSVDSGDHSQHPSGESPEIPMALNEVHCGVHRAIRFRERKASNRLDPVAQGTDHAAHETLYWLERLLELLQAGLGAAKQPAAPNRYDKTFNDLLRRRTVGRWRGASVSQRGASVTLGN